MMRLPLRGEWQSHVLWRLQRQDHSTGVLLALGRFGACRFGIVPSHATLAARARCSVSTVQRPLQAARELGLVDWSARSHQGRLGSGSPVHISLRVNV